MCFLGGEAPLGARTEKRNTNQTSVQQTTDETHRAEETPHQPNENSNIRDSRHEKILTTALQAKRWGGQK